MQYVRLLIQNFIAFTIGLIKENKNAAQVDIVRVWKRLIYFFDITDFGGMSVDIQPPFTIGRAAVEQAEVLRLEILAMGNDGKWFHKIRPVKLERIDPRRFSQTF